MSRRVAFVVAVLIVLALAAGLVYAQGKGRCGMGGPNAGICPMGQNGQGQYCPMGGPGKGMGAGRGPWWMNAQPQTQAEKAFIAEVKNLHSRIQADMAEINTLKARNGSRQRIGALEQEVTGLRTRLQDVMVKNRDMALKLGAGCMAMCANCPCKDKCPCYAAGTGKCVQGCQCPCVTGNCDACPMKDTCPMAGKQGPRVCPTATGQCPKAGSAGCPLTQPK